MKKKVKKIIIIIISAVFAVIIALFFAKNMIAKASVSAGVKAMTGLELSISSMNVGIFKTLISINELQLHNPAGFTDELMVDAPEIYVDYNLGAFFKGRVHLEEIRLVLKEFTVIKNEKGELNLDALKTVKEEEKVEEKGEVDSKEEETKMPEFQIDVLVLKIGKVVYKDYSKGTPPKVREFNVNIDERFENVTDPRTLANLIIVKALKNTTIARLTNFDLGSLQDGVAKKLKGVTGLSQGTVDKAKDAAGKALDKIKKILPFGK